MDSLLHTFTVDVLSEQDGRRYQGQFTTRKMSIRDMGQLGVRTSQLCGGLHYDPTTPGQGLDATTYHINQMIAQLEVSIVKAPEWFNLDTITDLSVLSAVYQEVADFETSFPRSGKAGGAGRHSAGGQTGGQAQTPSAEPVGDAQQVVGSSVQSALEP